MMFHTGGVVVSQDLETGTKCGEWLLPKGSSVVGGGCANESGWSILTLVKTKEGKVSLKKAQLPEYKTAWECKGSAQTGRAAGGRCGGASCSLRQRSATS